MGNIGNDTVSMHGQAVHLYLCRQQMNPFFSATSVGAGPVGLYTHASAYAPDARASALLCLELIAVSASACLRAKCAHTAHVSPIMSVNICASERAGGLVDVDDGDSAHKR